MLFVVLGIIFALVFAIVAIVLLSLYIKKVIDYSKLPVISEKAKVLHLHSNTQIRRKGSMNTETIIESPFDSEVYYQYIAEFSLRNRKKLSFKINKKTFIELQEGKEGLLYYKGDRFISFVEKTV